MTEELFLKYMTYGGGEKLGEPCTPECVEQDGQGQVVRYRDFQRGAIYWTFETGVSVVVDEKILKYWRDMGPQGHMLGYPTKEPKEDRGGVYNRFQRGTIYCNFGACQPIYDRRSSQDISRWISIFIVTVIWFIGVLIISLTNSEGMVKGLLSVVTFLLGPLTALLINLLWKQPKEKDFDIF